MESQKALEILSRARENGDIVCVYTSAYSDKFAAGFVEGVGEKHVALRSLTPNGRADGWFLNTLEDVARIDWKGRYEEKLLLLAQMREARWKSDLLPLIEETTNLPVELLLAARQHDLPVRVNTGSNDPAEGFVVEVTSDWVEVDKIARGGQFDGRAVVELDDIEKILVGEEDLQDLALLARHCGRGTEGGWG